MNCIWIEFGVKLGSELGYMSVMKEYSLLGLQFTFNVSKQSMTSVFWNKLLDETFIYTICRTTVLIYNDNK